MEITQRLKEIIKQETNTNIDIQTYLTNYDDIDAYDLLIKHN